MAADDIRGMALGHPFAWLTPSYGPAIGASGDRPVALTQLIGIVANEGRAPPAQNVASLEFEKVTPYETRFDHASVPAQTVLAPAIVDAVRAMLRDVVQGGTATRFAD